MATDKPKPPVAIRVKHDHMNNTIFVSPAACICYKCLTSACGSCSILMTYASTLVMQAYISKSNYVWWSGNAQSIILTSWCNNSFGYVHSIGYTHTILLYHYEQMFVIYINVYQWYPMISFICSGEIKLRRLIANWLLPCTWKCFPRCYWQTDKQRTVNESKTFFVVGVDRKMRHGETKSRMKIAAVVKSNYRGQSQLVALYLSSLLAATAITRT